MLGGSNAYRLVVHWGAQGGDVSVYLRAGRDDSAVVGLRQRIAADTDTVAVSYVSQEEAWQFLADNLGASAELLDGLEPSVLPASLEISLATVVDEGRLRAKLERWRAMPEVADIQYNHAWTERLSNAMGVIRWVAWALGALALMASAVIVLPTPEGPVNMADRALPRFIFLPKPQALKSVVRRLAAASRALT